MHKNILPHIILICGVLFLGWLLSNAMKVQRIKKHGEISQAVWTGETKEHNKMLSYIFNFKTKSGETVTISMLPPISEDRLKSGEAVYVRYMETDPRATARFVGKEYGASGVLSIFGILMVLYGIYGIRAGRRG